MNILKLTKARGIPGAYGGTVNLHLLLDGITLRHPECSDEYVLSLRDEIFAAYLSKPEVSRTASLSLGSARAQIMESNNRSGFKIVQIAIEGDNVQDFIALYREVYGRLGIPHEELPVPQHPLSEPSFVRGIRNDARELKSFLKTRAQRMKHQIRQRLSRKAV